MNEDHLIQKYREYREKHGVVPKVRAFLKFAGAHPNQLTSVFGRDAFSKLQRACGDEANKLELERTPRQQIMRQYGDLALELGTLPNSSDWMHRRLKPSISGLQKAPHSIKWSSFAQSFAEWVESEQIQGYSKVLGWINAGPTETKVSVRDRDFDRLVSQIRVWSPARRRNSEGEYKVELRSHLATLGYSVKEEFGESNFDLLVNGAYAIELKKDPSLAEYDRLFGQLARHLQHQLRVVALILDAPSEDNFSNFALLVDQYLNKDERVVDIIKR